MEELLEVDDLVKAWKVTPVWIYKLVRQKRIPFIHLERCIRFKPLEIEKWLEDRRNKEWALCRRTRGRG